MVQPTFTDSSGNTFQPKVDQGAGTLVTPHQIFECAQITVTDRSGTIAAGGTAQALAPANANRKGLWIQNISVSDLWVNEIGGTAVVGGSSFRIPAGSLWENPLNGVTTTAVSIIGATTSQAFVSREW